MIQMPMERASLIYNLLVDIGKAPENERYDFIYAHSVNKEGCEEWRFQGNMGFGGKYWSDRNEVTYYPEDETDFIKLTTYLLNQALLNI
jgi:hypothetical protein